MMRFASLLLILTLSAISAWSQGKGVDKTSERVRDSGTAGRKGTKTTTGTGPGIDFCGGRNHVVPPLPNPYPIAPRRGVILQTVAHAVRDRKLIFHEGASTPAGGIIV